MSIPTFLGDNTDDSFALAPEDDPLTHPAYYQAAPALAKAVNIALRLDKPLLLTGDPGTGKSQLAERIAWEFRHLADWWPHVLRFDTKSVSEARDLFYQHIEFPNAQTLAAIVEKRISAWLAQQGKGGVYLRSDPLLKFFHACREQFDYQPSTSEALQWLLSMHLDGARLDQGVAGNRQHLANHAGVVAKKKEDLDKYAQLLDGYADA